MPRTTVALNDIAIGTITPIVRLRPCLMACTSRLGLYFRRFATASTRVRVSSEIRPRPLSARDTVIIDTPSSSAICLTVEVRRGFGVGIRK